MFQHVPPAGAALTMTPRLSALLLLLLSLATVSVLAQRRRQSSSASTATGDNEWNYRDGCERPHYSLCVFTLWAEGPVQALIVS